MSHKDLWSVVSYLYEEHRAEIVITFLHSIMDAVSGTNLIDELLGLAALLHSGEAKTAFQPGAGAGRSKSCFRQLSKAARRIPALLAYFFSQMGEEIGYRWKVRGKQVAGVQPGGKGHILSLTCA